MTCMISEESEKGSSSLSWLCFVRDFFKSYLLFTHGKSPSPNHYLSSDQNSDFLLYML